MTPETRLIHPQAAPTGFRALSTPIHQASTVLFDTLDDFDRRQPFDDSRYTYGLAGTPTTRTLAQAVADWEGGVGATLAPSGLSAVSLALMATLKSGDRVLLPTNVYAPARAVLAGVLSRLGVRHALYDPLDLAALESALSEPTAVVWVETPGSITLEVADLPAIAQRAHAVGAKVIIDNTWSSGRLLRVFELGADLSVQALTKYHGGHGDVLMGAVIAPSHEAWRPVRQCAAELGLGVSGAEASLVLRGMQTMALRLQHVGQAGEQLARWLATHPEVQRVLHPALPECPGHVVWQRDFTGSAGLFSLLLHPRHTDAAVAQMLQAMQLFQMGASWGGTASLALAYRGLRGRIGGRSGEPGGHIVRLNIGLESYADLQADLERGFSALVQASA